MTFRVKQQDLPPLISALGEPRAWPHPVGEIRVIETHISWIILTGEFAYKIKRPLDLGFLDFTTLDRRLDACREELRLNRRTAPSLYLDVVAICGDAAAPSVCSIDAPDGEVLEYAVKMVEFPQERQLDRFLIDGDLILSDMHRLARHVAAFHLSLPGAQPGDSWNGTEKIARLCRDNIETLLPLVDDSSDNETLERLRHWTDNQVERLDERIGQRFANGFVRECHGDLHLSNIVKLEDGFAAFDCIEFDPSLRWMDTMSEVAFLVMDLAARHRVDLAWRFLNRYLDLTGDYGGVALLRMYIVYATMVRAKIAAIHAEQDAAPGSELYAEQARRYRMHLGLAERVMRPRHPVILLTHGLSGSGKSWLTSRLTTALPAIRLRSDMERKRLHGLGEHDRSRSAKGEGIYTAAATAKTYDHLRHCAAEILSAKFDVIVDASFLLREQRQPFADLAHEYGAQLLILECKAAESALRDRVMQRAWDGADASEASWEVVLDQMRALEPLDEQERRGAITVDCSEPVDPLRITGAICSKLGRDASD